MMRTSGAIRAVNQASGSRTAPAQPVSRRGDVFIKVSVTSQSGEKLVWSNFLWSSMHLWKNTQKSQFLWWKRGGGVAWMQHSRAGLSGQFEAPQGRLTYFSWERFGRHFSAASGPWGLCRIEKFSWPQLRLSGCRVNMTVTHFQIQFQHFFEGVHHSCSTTGKLWFVYFGSCLTWSL